MELSLPGVLKISLIQNFDFFDFFFFKKNFKFLDFFFQLNSIDKEKKKEKITAQPRLSEGFLV